MEAWGEAQMMRWPLWEVLFQRKMLLRIETWCKWMVILIEQVQLSCCYFDGGGEAEAGNGISKLIFGFLFYLNRG